ncbi:MAG: DUF4105 domain-containing protein [Thermodesulfobacteriota bacterium]
MLRSFIVFFLKKYGILTGFVFLLLSQSVYSSDLYKGPENYFLLKAKSLKLHEKRYWHILLHYYKTPLGFKSRIDDPDFFISESGKSDPEAELRETISHLLGSGYDKKNVCRFYARYKWLKSELDPDNKLTKDIQCEDIENIKPETAAVIFPTYYMNNPASMFGHTFLTISSEYTNMRLADSVNYAAEANTNNGINFAIRGIFGFFKGYYAVMPYYKKIQEYSDINQRDIWEYKLNLTPDELKKMVWHIKELNQIYTDYYFFKENCSFNLLYLIEAARPEINLTKRFKMVVIPIDTIKAMKQENLIDSVKFRPSKTTVIKTRLENLSKSEQKTAKDLVYSKNPRQLLNQSGLNKNQSIMLADFALDLIQYLYIEEKIEKKHYKKQFLKLLKLRSLLGKYDEKTEIDIPEKPDKGHDSARISAAFGVSDNDIFQEIRFRPAFTDMTDTDYIHDKGAKIEFLDTRLRYYSEKNNLMVEHLDFIDIMSVSPRDEIFKPVSWKVNTGLIRKKNHNLKNGLIYQLNTGGGFGYKLFDSNYIGYSMFEQRAEFGGNIKNSFNIGAGLSAGVFGMLTDNIKLNVSTRYLRFIGDDKHSLFESDISANYKLSTNNHLTFELGYENIRKTDELEYSAVWNYFF